MAQSAFKENAAQDELLRQGAGRELKTGDTRAPRILIVDDIEDNRAVLLRRFQRRGFEVVEAESGLKAVEYVSAGDFDAVLLDVMMPEMDGLETLRRLRAIRPSASLPIIMVTARSESGNIVE